MTVSIYETSKERLHEKQKHGITYFLLRQLLRYSSLLQLLIALHETLFHTLNTISLDIAGADQNTFQCSQSEVVVRLWRQLLLAQPAYTSSSIILHTIHVLFYVRLDSV